MIVVNVWYYSGIHYIIAGLQTTPAVTGTYVVLAYKPSNAMHNTYLTRSQAVARIADHTAKIVGVT